VPTFMSEATFAQLSDAQQRLARDMPNRPDLHGLQPSYVFVPWAGSSLSAQRGIYYVGIAVNAEGPKEDQTFQGGLMSTEGFSGYGRENAPFWRFLDRLTRPLLGGAYHETLDRWGWSNLLKIAGNKGSPSRWPAMLSEYQREACVSSLREEFAHIHQSLVFIASLEEYGILRRILPSEEHWNKEFEATSRLWWIDDSATGNLYIHSYHPNFLQQNRLSEMAVVDSVELARRVLPPFIAHVESKPT
jgi:hypothetical protein